MSNTGISETRFGSSRPRPRLKRSESQWRDRDRDWKGLSLNDETETETEKVWVSMTRPRPRLKGSESQSRDRDRDHKNIETKTKVVETIKDETSKFGSRLISENLSRPRLIETEQFCRCRDRDSSRLGNFIDVETETYRDWEILRLSRPRLIETGQKMSRPRLYRESRWSLLGTEYPTTTLQYHKLLLKSQFRI